jgi:hypothetical protein
MMKMMPSCAAPPMKTELCLLYHWALTSHGSSLVDPPALGWELRHSMAFHTIFFQENTSSLLIFKHGDLIIDCAWRLRNSGNESGHTPHLTPHTSHLTELLFSPCGVRSDSFVTAYCQSAACAACSPRMCALHGAGALQLPFASRASSSALTSAACSKARGAICVMSLQNKIKFTCW